MPEAARAPAACPVARRIGRRQAAEQPLEGPLDQTLGSHAAAGRCADAGRQGGLGTRPSGGLRSALAKILKGDELIQVPPPSAVADGHSIALVGYDDDPRNAAAYCSSATVGGRSGVTTATAACLMRTRGPTPTMSSGWNWGRPIPRCRWSDSRPNSCPWLRPAAASCSVQDMGDWERAMWSRASSSIALRRKRASWSWPWRSASRAVIVSACWRPRRPTSARSAWRSTGSGRGRNSTCTAAAFRRRARLELGSYDFDGRPAPHAFSRVSGRTPASAGIPSGSTPSTFCPTRRDPDNSLRSRSR